MKRIHQHHASDAIPIQVRVCQVHISAERVSNENVWTGQTCGIQERVQFLRDLVSILSAYWCRSI
jgi:hypothetical protein